ncbi:MAG: flavodoxin family protein [Clostridiales bacterium]|nr:flavodoxin family protein [Clostridiales bacterium]
MKKTLILNGSPRLHGDTVSLIHYLTDRLAGAYKIVDAYRCAVSPCIDCRFCWTHEGCAIQDEMQILYREIQESDHIVIASPIYFSELTGKLLDVASRLQTFYCSRTFRNIEPIAKTKKGAVVLVGGGDGAADKAYKTACILLRQMKCESIFPLILSHHTNERPALQDERCLLDLEKAAAFFNQ